MADTTADTTPSPPVEPDPSCGGIALGLIFGAGLGVAAVPLGLFAGFAVGGDSPAGPSTWLAVFAPGALELAFGVILAARPRSRRFGLGMLIGTVLGAFTTAVACGAFR